MAESLDPRDYYTMSASGVTHFVAGVDMDFCTLERWEREHALFTKCKQLAVFKDFRKWKGFSSWKRVVKRAKMRARLTFCARICSSSTGCSRGR